MNVLAFDTCFDACSVAAGRRLRSLTPSIAFATAPMVTGQAEQLMPMIDDVMRDAGLKFAELDRIVVTAGPGTFTGARIAVAAARALALATGAEIVTFSSLELMAMHPDVSASAAATLAIATDARREEVYFQAFDARSLACLTVPLVLRVEDAAQHLAGQSAVIAGSGAEAVALTIRAQGGEAVAIRPALLPEAIDMLFASIERRSDPRPIPFYLRPPDAKPPQPGPIAGSPA